MNKHCQLFIIYNNFKGEGGTNIHVYQSYSTIQDRFLAAAIFKSLNYTEWI